MSRESAFQKKIMKVINDKYGICIKYNIDYKAKAGIPDLFAAVNNRAIFIEVKTDKGELSALQSKQIERIKKTSTKYVYKVAPKDYNYFIKELDKIKEEK